ncbi:MAG: hypothetical protein ACK40E_03810 [Caldimicrobium sp.]
MRLPYRGILLYAHRGSTGILACECIPKIIVDMVAAGFSLRKSWYSQALACERYMVNGSVNDINSVDAFCQL